MSAQEIIQIANELSARGITPSTAMVGRGGDSPGTEFVGYLDDLLG